MNIHTTAGILILIAFASYIYMKWRRDGPGRAGGSDISSDGGACEIAESSFLDAIENICGGAAFVFDSGLKVLSCGKHGFILARNVVAARHMIDLLPGDASQMVLERIVALRANDIIECCCLWDSRPVRLVMLSLGRPNMGLIVIPPCTCRLAENALDIGSDACKYARHEKA